jgi:hypothetical protein
MPYRLQRFLDVRLNNLDLLHDFHNMSAHRRQSGLTQAPSPPGLLKRVQPDREATGFLDGIVSRAGINGLAHDAGDGFKVALKKQIRPERSE